MFCVEFKFSGLYGSYSSMQLNFTGFRGNLSAMESGDGISFEIWNETQKAWLNDTGMSAFWNNAFVNGTYRSTNTWIYRNITDDGILYVRIRNWNVSGDTADCWLWIDFLGISVISPRSSFADYGKLEQANPVVAGNPLQFATAVWGASNLTTERYM
ncbi:MAG: hypothetical protein N3F63_08250, partial [Thermoplasmata archaeon]|nr:hypothetical protein [Thermoplasmata archaeon]